MQISTANITMDKFLAEVKKEREALVEEFGEGHKVLVAFDAGVNAAIEDGKVTAAEVEDFADFMNALISKAR